MSSTYYNELLRAISVIVHNPHHCIQHVRINKAFDDWIVPDGGIWQLIRRSDLPYQDLYPLSDLHPL